jgi:acetylornithine deacetylase/succinyl-diaminopimelate desuccinylase-like protein
MGNRTTWEKQWEAARWIVGEFARERILARIETYDHQQQPWPNVVASIPGKDDAAPPVLLLAHLDSISAYSGTHAPGADDNGTGIAALLETARFLNGKPVRRTVVLCIFSNEERGAIGSKAFARRMRLEGKQIHAVLNLDILGYNAPRYPMALDAVASQGSWSARMKVAAKMIASYVLGAVKGKDRIIVAGRVPNAALVERAARTLAADTGLQVDRVVRDDCG